MTNAEPPRRIPAGPIALGVVMVSLAATIGCSKENVAEPAVAQPVASVQEQLSPQLVAATDSLTASNAPGISVREGALLAAALMEGEDTSRAAQVLGHVASRTGDDPAEPAEASPSPADQGLFGSVLLQYQSLSGDQSYFPSARDIAGKLGTLLERGQLQGDALLFTSCLFRRLVAATADPSHGHLFALSRARLDDGPAAHRAAGSRLLGSSPLGAPSIENLAWQAILGGPGTDTESLRTSLEAACAEAFAQQRPLTLTEACLACIVLHSSTGTPRHFMAETPVPPLVLAPEEGEVVRVPAGGKVELHAEARTFDGSEPVFHWEFEGHGKLFYDYTAAPTYRAPLTYGHAETLAVVATDGSGSKSQARSVTIEVYDPYDTPRLIVTDRTDESVSGIAYGLRTGREYKVKAWILTDLAYAQDGPTTLAEDGSWTTPAYFTTWCTTNVYWVKLFEDGEVVESTARRTVRFR